MRLMCFVTLIVLGLCLAYAHQVKPVVPETTSYDGPATFLSLLSDADQDAPARWLLVCRVGEERVAFSADEPWVRQAIKPLHPGQHVTLRYELPAKSHADDYAELGPPTLRAIAPAAGDDADFVVAPDALAFNAARH